MKKYLTKQASTFKYVFKSPWKIKVEQVTMGQYVYEETTYNDDVDFVIENYAGVEDNIREMFDETVREDKDVLAQILYEQKGIISEIDIDITGNYITTTVLTKNKLSDEQLEDVKDFMEGQFSDGFGEGLEGREADSVQEDGDMDGNYPKAKDYVSFEQWAENENIEVSELDDDDYDETYHRYTEAEDEECTTTRTFYINLWPDNFELKLVQVNEV